MLARVCFNILPGIYEQHSLDGSPVKHLHCIHSCVIPQDAGCLTCCLHVWEHHKCGCLQHSIAASGSVAYWRLNFFWANPCKQNANCCMQVASRIFSGPPDSALAVPQSLRMKCGHPNHVCSHAATSCEHNDNFKVSMQNSQKRSAEEMHAAQATPAQASALKSCSLLTLCGHSGTVW